jgi:hypothetical protein
MLSHSQISRKVLQDQTQEVVLNVLQFMHKEADEHKFVIPVAKVHERVASTVRVSKSAIKNIKKEMLNLQAGTAPSYNTPKRNRPCLKIHVFSMCVLRRTTHEFCLHEKCLLSINAVLTKLQESTGYKGKTSILLDIFKGLGYQWTKMWDNRRIRIEKQDVRCVRVAFLPAITKFRRDGHEIVYSDETYIHSSCTTTKAWSDDDAQGCMAASSKGQQLIIVHVGMVKGFIRGT